MSKKQTGMSSFAREGRTGKRYRTQINKRRYEKYFYGTKEARDAQFAAWRDSLIEKQKKRNLDGSVTFDFFSDKYLYYLRNVKDKNTGRNLYKPRTIEEYKYALKNFKEIIGIRYMNDLTFEKVAEYRRIRREAADERKEDYYGVNKDTGCNIRAFKWGMQEALVPVINLDSLEALRVSKVIVAALQPWQMDILIKYSNLKMRIATKLGYYSSCRPEEVYNMLLAKLDFKKKIGWVENSEEDKSRGIEERDTKFRKERPIDLKDDLIADIIKLNPKSPYLLTDKHGNKYTTKNFSNAFKRNLKHVNRMILEHEPDTPPIKCTFKTLRKTSITQTVDRGAKIEDASKYAGHAGKEVTEEHYLTEEVRKKRERAEKLKHLKKVKKYLPGSAKKAKK